MKEPTTQRHVQVPKSVTSNISTDKKVENKKQYTDVLVYALLRKNMNSQTMTAFISIRNISKETELSTNSVLKAITRLELSGDIQKIKSEKIKNCNCYKFNPNSEKFEMYDFKFLDNQDLNPLQKAYYMNMQPHLYVDKKTGIAKTTYGDKELSELTGMSKKVIKERKKELEELGFINRRLTTDNNGNSCEALEFNLPKFGQYVLTKIDYMEEDITALKMELNAVKSELKLFQKLIKTSRDISDASIII